MVQRKPGDRHIGRNECCARYLEGSIDFKASKEGGETSTHGMLVQDRAGCGCGWPAAADEHMPLALAPEHFGHMEEGCRNPSKR